MVQRINPLKTAADIQKIRDLLAERPKDLFIFDLLTQTGLLLGQVIDMKVETLAAISEGDSIPLHGLSASLEHGPRLTRLLHDSFNRYVDAHDLRPDSYLFQSRKGNKPLAPQSVSRLVSAWFRQAGLQGLAGIKSLRKTWEKYYKDTIPKEQAANVEKPKSGLLGGVSPLTLSDQIETRLIDLILTGQIAPGSRLVIKEIADEMGISPMPARDALNRLAAGGVVTLEKNRGYVVNGVSQAEFEEITDLRRILEPMAAVTGCRNAQPEDIHNIRRCAADYEAAMHGGLSQTGIRANRDFHFNLYRLARRPILLQFLEKLWRMISPYYHFLSKELQALHLEQRELGEYYQRTIHHHHKIVECITDRNYQALARWIEDDIDYSAQKVLSDFYNR